ncbi:CDP-alcohol phosphatidyltransferase family protein [Desulforhabdus amnigena]|jgi:CDP-diacylglycerol--glycerol-3-phosphate 3-phosphatidyltransferase|uniref:CDP-diacylglycerol--inositol 3-phosphatidyltransferase n=1 Tax=Desulforhabdus amnigena TaxID=40218 RepID=A0A9W6FVZ4_9BACT|nr:CDP-alcohol phosphatidyltransferase family protein [Desulforhabdus amnigena]NLJ26967.1 CDP-alcohol phosphatidyltransferase family protein [Deltaproteobacteria bacterium]GLI35857.1 CDP-diacylglycerol--inositol 3-phosphatidyltransferase [Desulforhabdus amnigena]
MLKGTPIETGYYHLLERYLVPGLIHLKLKPNHISLTGFVMSMLAGIAFVFSPVWGGLLTLLTGLLDTLDGSLARSLGQTRKFGAFLDSVLDRYTELIIYLGIWCYFYRQGETTPFFSITILLILFGSLMVSYTRARAEGLGVRCLVGFFQRGERIILIGLAGVFNSLFNWLTGFPTAHWARDIVLVVALLLLAVGTNLTALWRFLHVLNSLRS